MNDEAILNELQQQTRLLQSVLEAIERVALQISCQGDPTMDDKSEVKPPINSGAQL